MVPWVRKGGKKKIEGDAEGESGGGGGGEQVFQRYYHLYRKGELESDVVEAGGQVLESGYEKDNWWAIARVRS